MARGSAQELFRDNIGSVVDVGVQTLFAENIVNMGIVLDPALDGHDPETAADVNKALGARAAAEARENHDGVISGSRDGVRSGVAERVVDARESKAAASERDQRRADEIAFYVALMQSGDFTRFAAERGIEQMSDSEIEEFITAIEEATGKTLDENMDEILGPEGARLAGESDVEYFRRVGPDAADVVVRYDAETDQFVPRPGYENHPLLPFMTSVAARGLVDVPVQEASAALAAGADGAEVAQQLHQAGATDQGLLTSTARLMLRESFQMATNPEQEVVLTALNEDRNLGRDDNLNTEERADNSANVLDSFGLGQG